MPFFYFDVYYLVLVMPMLLLALWAQFNVNHTFQKYSAVPTRSRMTGYDSARRILDANGLSHVRIEHIAGNLTDHYDPRADVIRLSDAVYHGNSVAAVGVAAHEAGHAVQYAENYFPIRVRTAIIPVTNIGSRLSIPLILIGLLFMGTVGEMFATVGILLFSLTTVFQLVTLPVEFNASRRAVTALSGGLQQEEVRGTRKVLTAAALTYVAALAVSVMQLLRLILIVGGGRRNRR